MILLLYFAFRTLETDISALPPILKSNCIIDLLWHEWIECNALRRVYYLESDYYEERLDELDNIRKNSDPEDPYQKVSEHKPNGISTLAASSKSTRPKTVDNFVFFY